MSALDLSKLSGPDAIVALRSYPRRYREGLAPLPDDPDLDELAHRIGPDGLAAIDHVVIATNTMTLLGQALHQIAIGDDPALHPAVIDRTARTWHAPSDLTLEAALADLEREAGALAEAADHVHGPDWNRTGHAADGPPVSAIALVRDAVAAGADELRAAVADLAAARR